MKKIVIRHSAFLYALKIWLTSLVLGPVAWLAILPSMSSSLSDYCFLFLLQTGYALIYSLPCFLLLWLEVHVIEMQAWPQAFKRVVAAVVSVLIWWVLVRVVMRWYKEPFSWDLLFMFAGYVFGLLAGVWVWRWPATGIVEDGPDEQATVLHEGTGNC